MGISASGPEGGECRSLSQQDIINEPNCWKFYETKVSPLFLKALNGTIIEPHELKSVFSKMEENCTLNQHRERTACLG